MIREISGNILNSDAGIIAHQVNCQGVMGAGVAKAIKENLLSVENFLTYKRICASESDLLGRNQYCKEGNKIICNMFAEDVPTGRGLDTDYLALKRCIMALKWRAGMWKIKKVAIPGYLGCGLAGGDWEFVYSNILLPEFKDSDVTLEIVYFPDALEKLHKSYQEIPKDGGVLQKSWHGFPKGTPAQEVDTYISGL